MSDEDSVSIRPFKKEIEQKKSIAIVRINKKKRIVTTKHSFKIDLEDFQTSANTGYKIAKSQHEKLCNTLNDARKQIQNVIDTFDKSKFIDSNATDMLESQLQSIKDSFKELEIKTGEDISSLKKSLSKFSITLFGRTMAGKSTLMEYFKHGSGESIGKGSQRRANAL